MKNNKEFISDRLKHLEKEMMDYWYMIIDYARVILKEQYDGHIHVNEQDTINTILFDQFDPDFSIITDILLVNNDIKLYNLNGDSVDINILYGELTNMYLLSTYLTEIDNGNDNEQQQ